MAKGRVVPRHCRACGNPFLASKFNADRGQGWFCSYACNGRFHVAANLHWRPATERFWEKVKQGGTDECWPWLAYSSKDHYGRFRFRGTVRTAHSVAWELINGPIPDGKEIMHSCDNPPCVNPSHLSPGTRTENIRDCIAKGRRAPKHGEFNGHARLTPDLVREIRLGRESTVSIGKRLGIHQTTISLARLGRTWKHVR